MGNYKEMYLTLFRETSRAIQLLQQAQQQAEELFLESEHLDKLILIPRDNSPPTVEDDDEPVEAFTR